MTAHSIPGPFGTLIACGVGTALGGFFPNISHKGLVSAINHIGVGQYQLVHAVPLSIANFQPDITLLTVNGGQWSIQPTSFNLLTLFTFDNLGAPKDIDFCYRYWQTGP